MTETVTDLTPLQERRISEHLAAAERARLAYEKECQEYAERGYRPHYCEHGTNLWVDYDPICGPCEDGTTWEEIARAAALQDVDLFLERVGLVIPLVSKGAPHDATDKLIEWAQHPVNYEPRY